MAKRRPSTMANADRVFDALASIGSMSKRDICNVTGLTASQVALSFRVIKEELASLHAAPIVYDPSTDLYTLNADQDDIEAYQEMRTNIHLVQLRNLLTGTVEPALQAMGDTLFLRLARRQLTRLVEDLEELAAA